MVCFAVTACLNTPATGTSVTPEGLGSFTPPVDVTAAVVNLAVLPRGVVAGGLNGVTFTPDGFAHRAYDADWSAWTGTAGLQWDPDRDTMMYARYSRGYKAGGFNVGISTTEGPRPDRSEHANSYEVGLKKDLSTTPRPTWRSSISTTGLPGAGDVPAVKRGRPVAGRLPERAQGSQLRRRARDHPGA